MQDSPADTARKQKKAKHNAERPSLSDWKADGPLYATLSIACDLMKVRIATEMPFLSKEEYILLPPLVFADAVSRQGLPAACALDIKMKRLVSQFYRVYAPDVLTFLPGSLIPRRVPCGAQSKR